MTTGPTEGPAGVVPDREAVAAALAEAREHLAALRREHDAVTAASEASNADDEHDPEGATIAFERAQIAALAQAARARVEALEAAAARVADGSYGRCASCGRPIGAERLAARPDAVRCRDCA